VELNHMTATVAPFETLTRRVLRSSTITLVGFAASQGIRLATNVVLARLLFPEAFGMMALVSVIMVGFVMMTDVGLGPAIMQSRRGDEPAFLDTAWTIQIVRGGLLWLMMLAATPLLAWAYDEPQLNAFLPVAALGVLIGAFNPTRLETANRHLRAGQLTLIDIATQVASAAVAVLLAWAFQTIWALVAASLVSAALQLTLLHLLLPGHRNGFAWDKSAAAELVHFGKWILLSTLCGFAVGQGDKVILAHYLSLGDFGIYSIASSLAALPALLGSVVARRVLIPMYRDSPPDKSPANAARIRKLRAGALGIYLALSALFAFGSTSIVEGLYDPRYHSAAGVVMLIAFAQAPAFLIMTCDQSLLAAGDSRRFFLLTSTRAVLVIGAMLLGIRSLGLAGAIIGPCLANLAAYPMLAVFLKRHGAWDLRLDLQFFAATSLLAGAALWLNGSALASLL
jgi:O-antigen/teichoic acid export membrane protein